MNERQSIELFTGGGGLALGLEESGFRHELLVELNQQANDTIRTNQSRLPARFGHWNLIDADIGTIDFAPMRGSIELVAGGPPCQPFSLGGKHKGSRDHRDLFPQAVRTVSEIQPLAFIFENVRGLLRPAFASYFEYVLLQLRYPTITRSPHETVETHLSRLEKVHTSGQIPDLSYNVIFRCLNAADYGVPQRRERVFIVGFRSTLGVEWSFPKQTHGIDELIWSKWVTRDYWGHHNVPSSRIPAPTDYESKRALKLRRDGFVPSLAPWRTVRDALLDLPDPRDTANAGPVPHNHDYRAGARAYPGHTGSPLDEPAKTLKAGDHGVPGGENMMRLDDGSFRYFTVRESARIQTFPDYYDFPGSWTEAMRQIGNAVPVLLAKAVGDSVRHQIDKTLAGDGTKDGNSTTLQPA